MRVSAAYLERVAREYQAAYSAANEEPAPGLVWQRGWFVMRRSIGSSRKYRRAEIEEMRDELLRRVVGAPSTNSNTGDK